MQGLKEILAKLVRLVTTEQLARRAGVARLVRKVLLVHRETLVSLELTEHLAPRVKLVHKETLVKPVKPVLLVLAVQPVPLVLAVKLVKRVRLDMSVSWDNSVLPAQQEIPALLEKLAQPE
jgi:hypothetical protein